jgi:PEP-CTERM motif
MKTYPVLLLATLTGLSASAAQVFSDSFNYPDGSITAVSGGVWTTDGGTAGQVDVQSGVVNLTENESEDVSAMLSGNPYTTGDLYLSMLLNFSALPTASGGYGFFADFYGASQRGRLFVTTVGAAPGDFRLGVSNGSTLVSEALPVDLSLNQTYVAVVRYNLDSVATTVWVNPLSEADTSATAIDAVTASAIQSIELRQSKTSNTSMGTLTVDNLLVGTTFNDVFQVVPEPSTLTLIGMGGLLLGQWLHRRS